MHHGTVTRADAPAGYRGLLARDDYQCGFVGVEAAGDGYLIDVVSAVRPAAVRCND